MRGDRWSTAAAAASLAIAGAIVAVACKPQTTTEATAPAAETKPAAKAGYILPRPAAPFKGTIGQTYKDSKPDKIPIVQAPAGAPNVLLVLIDDSGFGTWSTFGGQIPTPNLDRLAKNGLRYTRFHTTALCSPTRAALLT